MNRSFLPPQPFQEKKLDWEPESNPSPNEVKPLTEAEQLLQDALGLVESDRIRQWAETEHNRPIWIKLADLAIQKQNGKPDVSRFSTFIIASAIGL